MKTKQEAVKILKLLKKRYPDAHCELNHQNAYELLMATILSAQCTDVQVNKVTKKLFADFPTVNDLATAKLSKIKEIIRSTGFYNNKANHLLGCAKMIKEKFGGEVPSSMEELLQLPGVGRKTANVVLGNAFKINSGIVVDTHVARISKILNLTDQSNPLKIEEDLMTLFPKKEWCLLSHLLISHGRKTCAARKRDCENCMLNSLCFFMSSIRK